MRIGALSLFAPPYRWLESLDDTTPSPTRVRLIPGAALVWCLEEGDWGLIVDPRGRLAVIRGNPANAAAGLGVGSGDLVWLGRAD